MTTPCGSRFTAIWSGSRHITKRATAEAVVFIVLVILGNTQSILWTSVISNYVHTPGRIWMHGAREAGCRQDIPGSLEILVRESESRPAPTDLWLAVLKGCSASGTLKITREKRFNSIQSQLLIRLGVESGVPMYGPWNSGRSRATPPRAKMLSTTVARLCPSWRSWVSNRSSSVNPNSLSRNNRCAERRMR